MEARCGLRVRFGIEFGQTHVRFQLSSSLGKGWRHLSARPTPGRPKIHHHGNLTAPNVAIKTGRIEHQGSTGEQILVALAAVRRAAHIGCDYAVGGMAVGADDVQGFGHGARNALGGWRDSLCHLATNVPGFKAGRHERGDAADRPGHCECGQVCYRAGNMPLMPSLTVDHALFLDFDGTLTDIAAKPDSVQVPVGLPPTLLALHRLLGGAVAIVTGRKQADVDEFLAPLALPMASEHGAQYRFSDGSRPAVDAPDLSGVLAAAQTLKAQHPGLLIETKRASVALHFRQAQHLETLCRETLEHAMRGVMGVELLHGKCVYEVKPAGIHKGQAIAAFMQTSPFAGRTPVFVGDDVTDEAGFASVIALGGLAIKVGEGPSQAQYRCMTPAALRGWLSATRTALEHAR